MNARFTAALAVTLLALAGCQCGPDVTAPDAGPDDSGVAPSPDASFIILAPETPASQWPTMYASEPCPSEAFGFSGDDGGATRSDGGLLMGICVPLRTLTADAFLDGAPETKPVKVQFISGGGQSELTRVPDPQGVFQVKVMRGRYDILQHQPGGVWPYFEGFIDHGWADMTRDQQRSFAATSHLLRGAVRFGGLPFTPNAFPQDVWFDAYGLPTWQQSMVTSSGGSYELRLLEGTFGLFLSTPAASLFGTELTKFPVTPTTNINFDHDQEFDVDIASSVLEASVTIDGEALADARTGPDFTVTYTRPGDTSSTVTSHHEGGLPGFTALIPRGQYGTTLDFNGLPNRTLPSRIAGKLLQQVVDLRQDTTFSVDFPTRSIEGSIVIDGRPARPNPNYNFQLYLFGIAGASASSSFLMYEVPLDTASFRIKAFPGNYFTILSLDDGLADDLATGFWVIDRYYQLQDNRSMPISLETARFQGKISIDGHDPAPNRKVGTFAFRNRAMQGQYSWFFKGVVPADDGTFTVKLPKGDYEVYFTIDRETYPTYASGRQLMFSRVPLQEDVTLEMNYETFEISGPLRVGGEVVADTLGGPEVGLSMLRQQDFQTFDWRFQGGEPNYVLRVPRGSYALDFVIFENALDGVAWGHASMGFKLGVALAGEPFMNFVR